VEDDDLVSRKFIRLHEYRPSRATMVLGACGLHCDK
jgi:hypothetical protein